MPHRNTPNAAQPTVLVVDDQPANLKLVGDLLTTTMGYEVIAASSGQQALRRLEARIPDLILLDVLMPGVNGIETCRQIQENPAWQSIPVIFLSASDDKNLIVRALETGGVDYVTKPFSRAELLSRVRTHLSLKYARDALQALAEDKDELLGILTHDLKNHLGGMQMSAQLLHDRSAEAVDERSRRLMGNIIESTTQMLAFVKEFLANSASERTQQMELDPVNLPDALTAALNHYQLAAARKNITLSWSPPPEPVRVMADSGALKQILENLVSNAVKFSPPGTTVTVSVDDSDEQSAACRIADEGPGFTEADHARMFLRYARLSARPTAGEPSTGLGLSIVKKLAESMRGKLTVESEPGAGATFTLRLPRPASSS